MVGACTPAASATERVVTASGPWVASSSVATSTSWARARSRDDPGSCFLMLSMITDICYQLISLDSVEAVSLITRRVVSMIIVTGATGALNGATVEHLLKLMPADRIGVSVRDVAKARHFAERGV